MTPDELLTRVHRQRTEQIAMEMALDALMTALPPELQQKWLAALRALQTKRSALLQSQQADPLALAQAQKAIDQRLARLEQAAQARPLSEGPHPNRS